MHKFVTKLWFKSGQMLGASRVDGCASNVINSSHIFLTKRDLKAVLSRDKDNSII